MLEEKKAAAVVNIRTGCGRYLKAGGPWIYDNEIESVIGRCHNGDIVEVRDFDRFPLGLGFINMNSKIRVRMLTRDIHTVIDCDFWRRRLQDAWEYRKVTVDTSCCRIIFGEADFLPGLVVDKYADVLVVQSLSLGIDRIKGDLIELLVEILKEDGIQIRGICERSDVKVREKEGLRMLKGFIGSAFYSNIEITENGIHYMVDVMEGQKTGFFLDQKYNRLAIQKLCRDAQVLDCFTHTGSFALNAVRGGAAHVTAVDASQAAVAQAEKNALMNNMSDRVEFLCRDVFEILPELAEEGALYDVVILDPPAFTKSRSSVRQAIRGYREINLRAMKLIRSGGFLATCSCSRFIEADVFAKTLHQAAMNVHKRLRQVEFRTQSPDHPILWGADETYYLKFYIFQVLDERS